MHRGARAPLPAQVLAQEGWRAFYRGMVPSMLGILPYAGVDITIFELLKERLLDQVRAGCCSAGGLLLSVASFSELGVLMQ